LNKDLRASHFMPAAIFAQLRTPAAKNPHPVLMTSDVSLISARQIKDYVLCGDCEQLFSRKGESWVLANMYRPTGFKLQDSLIGAWPVHAEPNIAVYAGNSIPGIDMDALVYFAMSIFWRAAVHQWRIGSGNSEPLKLGSAQEGIRKFLLGGPFPADAVVLVSAWPTRQVLPAAHTPRQGNAPGFEIYDFLIPGIEFRLMLGAGIPPDLRQVCAQTSGMRCIVSTPMLVDKVLWGIAPNKLYSSWLVYGQNALLIRSLNVDQRYYFAV
jgi:hypothetical protein